MTFPFTYHEELYRKPEVLRRLAEFPITVCGAGALGANLTESLARCGAARLRVIDRDRIEERNLSTQPYYRSDIGAMKAKVLANGLYRAVRCELDVRAVELSADNADKLLQGSQLTIDTFDNSISRQLVKDACAREATACLHVGLASEYAEILWNESYRVPSAAADDVCDYPLARNLVTLTVAVACEAVLAFVAGGEKMNLTVTLKDFSIQPFA